MQNYMPFGVEFNSNVTKDLKEIDKKIEDESKKDKIDEEKLMQLRMQKLYRGMEMNSGYRGNNYRAMYPY